MMECLRPLSERHDLECLCDLFWEENEETLPHCPVFWSRQDCEHWIREKFPDCYHDVYLWKEQDGEKVLTAGFLFSYDYHVYDGHCRVFAHFEPKADGTEALRKFLQILFREYPLRKVFLEASDLSIPLLETAKSVGFSEEARLLEYRYIRGAYHDVFILGLPRSVMTDT